MSDDTMPDDAPSAHSAAVGADELVRAIAGAELIVAGTVIDVQPVDDRVWLDDDETRAGNEQRAPDGDRRDRVHEAIARIARVLHGDRPAGDVRVRFTIGNAPSTRPSLILAKGETVLLFLRRASGGAGAARDSGGGEGPRAGDAGARASVGAPYVPSISGGDALRTLPNLTPPPARASKHDAVAHELEQIVLHAPETDIPLIVSAVIARLTLSHTIDPRLLDTPALQDPARRAAWLAIALAEGHVEALSAVRELPIAAFTPPKHALWDLLVHQVSEQRSPAARRELTALLRSPHSTLPLARAAITALRRLHDPATTRDLIDALSHADQTVRYQAMMGLSELYPDVDPGPSFDRYRAAESDFLDRWRRWWATRDTP